MPRVWIRGEGATWSGLEGRDGGKARDKSISGFLCRTDGEQILRHRNVSHQREKDMIDDGKQSRIWPELRSFHGEHVEWRLGSVRTDSVGGGYSFSSVQPLSTLADLDDDLRILTAVKIALPVILGYISRFDARSGDPAAGVDG